jgi:hypothetical protein
MVGKRVHFDDETWKAIVAVARRSGSSFHELADEAFADLLKKRTEVYPCLCIRLPFLPYRQDQPYLVLWHQGPHLRGRPCAQPAIGEETAMKLCHPIRMRSGIAEGYHHSVNVCGFIVLLVIVGGAGICLSHLALAEGNCPPGQTDQTEYYKGKCVDPNILDPQTGRPKKASKCPPGQTDKLKKYKGICMPIEAGAEDHPLKSR